MNESINRRYIVSRAAALAGLVAAGATPALLAGCGGGGGEGGGIGGSAVAVMPDAQVPAFWQAYFNAKSTRDADKLAALFAPDVVYEDNALRRRMAGDNAFIRSQWQALFSSIPAGPRSLLNAAHGTMSGAAVELTNEAGLFTSVAIDGLSIADLQNGKIARITDYWDSAQISDAEWAGLQAGFAMNPAWQPADTGDHPGASSATLGLQAWLARFFDAYASGNAASCLSFFGAGATYSNKPLGIEAKGTAAIDKVLNATLSLIPDGLGARLAHAVGYELGGGLEWIASRSAPGTVLRGATAIELAGNRISSMSVYFDSRLMTAEQKQKIADALK